MKALGNLTLTLLMVLGLMNVSINTSSYEMGLTNHAEAGFVKKVGKAIGKGVKKVGKAVGKGAKAVGKGVGKVAKGIGKGAVWVAKGGLIGAGIRKGREGKDVDAIIAAGDCQRAKAAIPSAEKYTRGLRFNKGKWRGRVSKLKALAATCGAQQTAFVDKSKDHSAMMRNIDRLDCSEVAALQASHGQKSTGLKAQAAQHLAAHQAAMGKANALRNKRTFLGIGKRKNKSNANAIQNAANHALHMNTQDYRHNKEAMAKLTKRVQECARENYHANKFNWDKETSNINGDKRAALYEKRSRGGRRQFVNKRRRVEARRRVVTAKSVGTKQFRMRNGQKQKFVNRVTKGPRIVAPRRNGMIVRRGSATTSGRSGRVLGRRGPASANDGYDDEGHDDGGYEEEEYYDDEGGDF